MISGVVPADRRVRTTVVACGALGPELAASLRQAGLEALVDLHCLPPDLHNTPSDIPERVRAEIRAARVRGDEVVVGYADCGTGGRLDAVCAEEGVDRLPGAHCYELFAGARTFAGLHAAEPGTFYLTDFLARSFDRLVVRGLGLDRHPELREIYFGNYRRLVHLAQSDDPDLDRRARAAAEVLGLVHERVATGLQPFAHALEQAIVAAHQTAETEPDPPRGAAGSPLSGAAG
ncbi:MAG: DUF1638 domain-containing protein [Nitriliruptoraceae bacterium]